MPAMSDDALDLVTEGAEVVTDPSGLSAIKLGIKVAQKVGDFTQDAKTAKALAEFEREDQRQMVDDVRVIRKQLESKHGWKDDDPFRPTDGDVAHALKRLGAAYAGAGSHGKRRILWNAFFSYFKPEFYREGMNKHLMRIAEEIEYPECRWLAQHLKQRAGKGSGVVEPESESAFLYRKLAALGLVHLGSIHGRTDQFNAIPTEIAFKFQMFVWDQDMWDLGGAGQ
jgi:hypothetical protein